MTGTQIPITARSSPISPGLDAGRSLRGSSVTSPAGRKSRYLRETLQGYVYLALLMTALTLLALSTIAAQCAPAATPTLTPEPTSVVAAEATAPPKPEATPTAEVTPTPAPVTLVFWHTQEPEAFRGKLLDGMIQDFMKEYPRITIESVFQGDYSDLYKKIIAAIAAGTPPDLAVSYPSMIAEYMKAEAVVELDPYINDPKIGLTEEDLKDIFPGYLAEARFPQFGNKYFAFPFTKSFVGMWYNLGLLKEVGYDAPPRTWDEFKEMACAVSEKTDAQGYAFYISASTIDAWWYSRGVTQLNDDRTEAVFNGPKHVAALQLLKDMIDEGCAYHPEGSYADQADFAQGKAAFTMSSTSGTYYYKENIEEADNIVTEWGQTMIPQSDPDNPVTVMYGASITVFKTTEEKQRAAWLFIKWFTDTEQTAKWGSKSGYMPVRASAAEALADYFAENPVAKEQFETIVPYGRPEPNVRGEQEIRDFIQDAWTAVESGVMTPQEALDEAVQKANEALARGRE